jgi:alcohol dehydrogenase (cytochrome c)
MRTRPLTMEISFCLQAVLLAACSPSISVSEAAGKDSAEEWTTINKDPSSQRYVDLDQITPGNAGGMKALCEIRLNEPGFFSSGLLMVDRTIYVTTFRATYAIDAATCALRWRAVSNGGPALHTANRGPAYLDGMVFRGLGDGRVVGLDAKTGELKWQQSHAQPKQLESFVAAPIAWDGKVFIGIAQGDLGLRGRLTALDAKTGQEVWRFHTVPEPGDATWGGGKPAGGGFWTTFSLDPTTREVFGPVGNPAPDFRSEVRPGDNFYTNAVVALDAATGRLNWHYQHTPRDDHDWDLGAAPTLYKTKGGKAMIAVAGKDGYVVGVDRATHEITFRTPVTTIANNLELPAKRSLVCPGLGGGVQFTGPAYQPELGVLFVGAVDWCSYYKKPKPIAGKPPKPAGAGAPAALGAPKSSGGKAAKLPEGDAEAALADFVTLPRGWITAVDGETGRVLWRHSTDAQMLAGIVTTKSQLVLGGDVRGNLFAFDGKTGAVKNHISVGAALNGGLISYAVDGTQYVAAAVGGMTLNPRGVAGPPGVRIYGLKGGDALKLVTLDRMPPGGMGIPVGAEKFMLSCAPCHGPTGQGGNYPSLARSTELGDPAMLKTFLSAVPPPMPVLYPSMLNDADVTDIAGFLKSVAIKGKGPTGPYVQPKSSGSPQWQAIYSVLTHPRCMNCHTLDDFPRQTDDRYPHVFGVLKGPDNRGVEMKRCDACHGITNNTSTGIPGRLDWHVPPLSMTSESSPGVAKSGPQLCADLKNKKKNNNRDLAQLVEFVESDQFILWGWDPGTRPNGTPRTTPPLPTHHDFIRVFKEWVAAGAPCPES